MNMLDRIIAAFDPVTGLKRMAARRVLARYEATRPSRTRKTTKDNSTGEAQVVHDAATARAMARDMERNHDLVRGALNTLVRNVVGPRGIGIEPTPRKANDDIDDDASRALLNLWRDWTRQPEVTATMNWVMCQQLVARSWFRDGELFAQLIEGPVSTLDHGTRVPFSIELLEADHVPLDYASDEPRVEAGIERNAWNRPRAFYVHKTHPGSAKAIVLSADALKRVPAERMLHIAVRDRISGLRGISQLVSALGRFQDIQEYESNEMVAARIASAIAAFVKRDKEMGDVPSLPTDSDGLRKLRLEAGTVFDGLLPGESIELLNPSRPNINLGTFRADQLRAASRGTEVSASTLSGNYNGTYSAQRQELVEQWSAYQTLTSWFVARFVQPTWERFVNAAVLSGAIRIPDGVRPETFAQAEFSGPPMPWINPVHEVNAAEWLVRAGFKSAQQTISERGGRLQDVYEQLARERRLATELELKLACDAANDTTRAEAATEPDDPSAPPPGPNPGFLNGHLH